MTNLTFYILYFVLGAATSYAFVTARWHTRMAVGFQRLSVMAATDHIPTADEVARAFGLKS